MTSESDHNRAQQALSHSTPRPVSPWCEVFDAADKPPILQRPRLVQRIIAAEARWVDIAGLPAAGRSTLLEQVAAALNAAGTPFRIAWTSQQADDLLHWIEQDALGQEGMVILVDDLDFTREPDRLVLALDRYLARHQRAKVITVSIEAIDPTSSRFLAIRPAELKFTNEEIASLCLEYGAMLDIELSSDAAVEALAARIDTSSGGLPLAVQIAMRKAFRAGAPQQFQGAGTQSSEQSPQVQVMIAINVFLHATVSSKTYRALLNRDFAFLQMLPRFSARHLSIIGTSSEEDLLDVMDYAGLQITSGPGGNYYSWRAQSWKYCVQISAAFPSLRIALAQDFIEAGEFGAAADQLILAGDILQAERLVADRFLTVFETLSPEAAVVLARLPASSLTDAPALGALKLILDPAASKEELLNSDNVMRQLMTAEHTASSLLARAIRVLIGIKCQSNQAELRAVCEEGLRALSAHTEYKTPAIPEVLLILNLAFIASGGFPSSTFFRAQENAPNYLAQRSAMLHQLVRLVSEGNAIPLPEPANQKLGGPQFRSLVYSSREILEQIDAFEALDGHFDSAIRQQQVDSDAFTLAGYDVKKVFRGFISPDSEPLHSLREAAVNLLASEPEQALARLEQTEGMWGWRIGTIRELLRAIAHLQQQNQDAASSAVHALDSVSDVIITQSLSLLPSALRAQLAHLTPRIVLLLQITNMITRESDSAPSPKGGLDPANSKSDIFETRRQLTQPLTRAEKNTLVKLSNGMTSREIALEEHLSIETVRTYIKRIAKKLNAHSQTEILQRAIELRLFDAE